MEDLIFSSRIVLNNHMKKLEKHSIPVVLHHFSVIRSILPLDNV